MRCGICASAVLSGIMLAQTAPLGCLPGEGGGGGGGLANLPPTVVLTVDNSRGVAPLTVQFSSSGSSDDGVIVTRRWDFGDGTTSQEISPTNVYTEPGVYTVRLTLTDDGGLSSSKSTVISVTERPVVIIDVDRTSAESAPATFAFDGSASYDPDDDDPNNLRFRWDFGDGSQEVLATVNHTYGTAGTYRVQLTVTDAVGVTGRAQRIIEVGIPRPEIEIRTPPDSVENIVVSKDSPLWVYAVYESEPGVPRTVRVGLDGDRDACDTLVALYATSNGSEVNRLQGPSEPIGVAVFAPDGETLLVGSDDGYVRLYDWISGALVRRYQGAGAAVTDVAFMPDGQSFIVTYEDGSVVERETGSDTILGSFVGHDVAVSAVAVSSDGSRVMTGDSSGLAIVWNAADRSERLRIDHNGAAVLAVAFSPVDPEVALTGAEDATARLWDTTDGSLLQEFAPVANGVLVAGHADAVLAVAFSPTGSEVLTGSADDTIKLWDARTGAEVRTWGGHEGDVNAVAFAPDGVTIASGSADDTARVWNVSTGAEVRTLEPCQSPITSVAFAPDGRTLSVAVAARNDIQLDTDPSSGNDLNLSVPVALDLSEVPSGSEGRAYYLWAEIDTNQTGPTRDYARAVVNVLPEFATDITDEAPPPVIPLRDSEAYVILPYSSTRQIFDLGPLDLGDRLHLSLVTLPGYGKAYFQEDYSLTVLDSAQRLYAWYLDGEALFSSASKMIIGHDSNSYFIVSDARGSSPVPSLHVRIERAFADDSAPRAQYVWLNFNETTVTDLTVAGSTGFSLLPFDLIEEPEYGGYDPEALKSAIEARVEDLLGPYAVTVSREAPDSSITPRLTIYFDISGAMLLADIPDRNNDGFSDVDDLQFYGLTNYIDPRNTTLQGRAVISVSQLVEDFPGVAAGQLGLYIGNAVVHHVGLLSGLRETTQPAGEIDDIMTSSASEVDNAGLVFTEADLASPYGLSAIGVQDADLLLTELFGLD